MENADYVYEMMISKTDGKNFSSILIPVSSKIIKAFHVHHLKNMESQSLFNISETV